MGARRRTPSWQDAARRAHPPGDTGTAPVAQWIEQPPPKRKVASSTLAWGTTAEPQVSAATASLTCGFVISTPLSNRVAACWTGVNGALRIACQQRRSRQSMGILCQSSGSGATWNSVTTQASGAVSGRPKHRGSGIKPWPRSPLRATRTEGPLIRMQCEFPRVLNLRKSGRCSASLLSFDHPARDKELATRTSAQARPSRRAWDHGSREATGDALPPDSRRVRRAAHPQHAGTSPAAGERH